MLAAITVGSCALPVLWKRRRVLMSSAVRRRSSVVLARIFSKSRKASRVQAISVAVGLISELLSKGLSTA